MKRKLTIEYHWNLSDFDDNVKPEVIEALEESAVEKIMKMIGEGYYQGELNDNMRLFDDDPEDGFNYYGWWSVKKEIL